MLLAPESPFFSHYGDMIAFIEQYPGSNETSNASSYDQNSRWDETGVLRDTGKGVRSFQKRRPPSMGLEILDIQQKASPPVRSPSDIQQPGGKRKVRGLYLETLMGEHTI